MKCQQTKTVYSLLIVKISVQMQSYLSENKHITRSKVAWFNQQPALHWLKLFLRHLIFTFHVQNQQGKV